jgi:lysophospholipase L1-like esterase
LNGKISALPVGALFDSNDLLEAVELVAGVRTNVSITGQQIAQALAENQFSSGNFSFSTFFAGRSGAYYNPSMLSSLFQDTAGTSPVTAVGQSVRRMNDLSGNGHHVTCPGTNPPVLQLINGGYCLVPVDETSRMTVASLVLPQPFRAVALVAPATTKPNDVTLFDSLAGNGTFLIYTPSTATMLIGGNGVFTSGTNYPVNNNRLHLIDALFSTHANQIAINGRLVRTQALTASTLPLNGLALLGIRGNPNPVAGGYAFAGNFYGAVFVGGSHTGGELLSISSNLMSLAGQAFRKQASIVTVLGDSIIADSTQDTNPLARAVPSLLRTTVPTTSVAVPGESIQLQQVRFLQSANKELAKAVVIQLGLNNILAGESTATIIGRLQTLVSTIQANSHPACKIFMATMTPGKGYFDANMGGGAAAAYTTWLDVNTAITGGGGTPVTGLTGVISSHTAALNNGSGSLLPQFTVAAADGLHPNLAGRYEIARAWEVELNKWGLL